MRLDQVWPPEKPTRLYTDFWRGVSLYTVSLLLVLAVVIFWQRLEPILAQRPTLQKRKTAVLKMKVLFFSINIPENIAAARAHFRKSWASSEGASAPFMLRYRRRLGLEHLAIRHVDIKGTKAALFLAHHDAWQHLLLTPAKRSTKFTCGWLEPILTA